MLVRRLCIPKRKSLFKSVIVCTILSVVLFLLQCQTMTGGAGETWPSVRLLVSSASRERQSQNRDESSDTNQRHSLDYQQVEIHNRNRISHAKASVKMKQFDNQSRNQKKFVQGKKYDKAWLIQQKRSKVFVHTRSIKGSTRKQFDIDDVLLPVPESGQHHTQNSADEKQFPRFNTGATQLFASRKSVELISDLRIHDNRSAAYTKFKSGNRFVYIGPPLSSFYPHKRHKGISGQSSAPQKTILLWTSFFGKENWLQDDHFQHCVVPNWHGGPNVGPCRVTGDKDSLLVSDAVIMHANDMHSVKDLPEQHPVHQRWLFYCQESPKHMNLPLSDFNSIFNYTYLMREDSDYIFRHGGIVVREKPMKKKKFAQKLAKIISMKTNLIAARISNCRPLERLEYIVELKKYVDVHFYGTCGNISCPKTDEECNGNKMKQYKFYLAFENSKCRDYITEKFWLPLHHWNSVPIVMGGAGPHDYRRVAPPHSYINTANFASPKDLAKYILLLDKKQTMYEEYFHWRKTYSNRRRKDNTLCQFCADLHNSSKPIKYYKDLKSWYELDSCKNTNETVT